MTNSRRRRSTSERAQATVELALVIPVLLLFVWTGVESLVLLRDQVLVTNAAREAARAAAVGIDPSAAATLGRARSGLDSTAIVSVQASGAVGDDASASVTLRERGRLPVIGRLAPDLEVRATVTMRTEGPPESAQAK